MGWVHEYNANHFKYVHNKGSIIPTMVVDRQKCVDDIYTFCHKNPDGTEYASGVLKSAMVGKVWYGAVEVRDGADHYVYAGICETCGKHAFDDTLWGHHESSEDAGEPFYDCPMRIMELLTAPRNSNAREWRTKVLAKHARAKVAEREGRRIPQGITITYKGGWLISSERYRKTFETVGVLYKKRSKLEALDLFISGYGTDAQRSEWARIKADREVAVRHAADGVAAA